MLHAEPAASRRTDRRVRVAGLVTHRQRPPTAGGVVFINLEDGLINIIGPAKVWERQRRIALGSNALLIDDTLERSDCATNLLAARLTPLNVTTTGRSRDFR